MIWFSLFYIRGIRLKDYDAYNPVVRNTFFCLQSKKGIPFERLNDDYCDCIEDGSDEPETNACANGVFYCTFQKRYDSRLLFNANDYHLTKKTNLH